jgi:FkbM family methyltransferase
MRNLYKNIVEKSFLRHLKKIKSKYFPNQRERRLIQEEEEANLRRRKFFSSFLLPGDFCFDVGANIGNRINPLLFIGAKVLAVEPQKSCQKILRKKFGSKIILITKGLGSKEEIKDFHISNSSTISSFSSEWINLVKDGRFKGYKWNKVVKTEMTTLDKLIQTYGSPKFIKIDVEGYELEVLKGLSTPVKYISFEYTVPEQLNKVFDCISRIEEIDNNIVFNYSIAESMELMLTEWISLESMKNHIKTSEFNATIFGDIYVKNENL